MRFAIRCVMRALKTICMLLAFFAMTSQALAYILPAQFIMRLLADKVSRLKIEDVSMKLESVTGDEASAERLYLKRGERARLVSGSEETVLYVENEGKISDRSAGALTGRTDVLAALLFPTGKNLDERSLRSVNILEDAGVDTNLVTLGRLDNRPVYIVGARISEPKKPQIWMDKELFVPVRSILYTGPDATGDKIEKRYLEYANLSARSQASEWFPSIIKTWKNDEFIKEQIIVEAKTNQKLPESLFRAP